SAQSFAWRSRPLVQILPVHVQRQRHPVALDPHAQRIGHRPDRLLLTQLRPRRVGGVIHHVDQTALRAALLQPRVEAPVHLHQLPKVLLALTPPTVGSTLPLPTPQPFRQHPASQRFAIDLQPILGFQVLRRQRRPKPFAHRPAVLLPYQLQHLPPKLRLVRTMRRPAPDAGGAPPEARPARRAAPPPPWPLPLDPLPPPAPPAGNSRASAAPHPLPA